MQDLYKINIYPISSLLHQKDIINEQTKELLDELLNTLNKFGCFQIDIVSLNELYNGDLAIILIQSGGSENEFLKILSKIKEPFYLLTYDTNNSLAASLEILSYIKQKHYEGIVLHGNVNELTKQIINLLNKENQDIVNLGVIGKPSDWLIGSTVDYLNCFRYHNIRLIDIPIDELVESYNNNIPAKSNKVFNFNQIEVQKALQIKQGLDSIIKKYSLKGLTIRCFDLLNTTYTTSCLALAMLNEEDIVATCEGDIPSMISMYIVKKILNRPSFQANPVKINTTESEMIFAHCTIPFNMVEKYSLTTHYESGIGVAIKGELRKEQVTIFKISNDLSNYFITTGTIIENLNHKNLCRTQIKVKIDQRILYFLNNPLGNHHLIIYGNYEDVLKKYMETKYGE